MKHALHLAGRGIGKVAPNPLVGAVVVSNGEILGRGWYKHHGAEHAEIMAIREALKNTPAAHGGLAGSTLYCTLEPCAGNWIGKKRPPCAERILAEKISRVVIAHADPNPRIQGAGITRLRRAGVNLRIGVLEDKCRKMNEIFIHYCREQKPFVLIKIAQTLDGRIAAADGSSAWISSQQSRKEVHRLRANYDAVLVGVETVIADNPSLTVRHVRGQNPLRIVLDSSLRIPLDSALVKMADDGKTLVICCREDSNRSTVLRQRGVKVVSCTANSKGHVDLRSLLEYLGSKQISSLLVEGGQQIYTSFTREALFDKICVYLVPMLSGMGLNVLSDIGVQHIGDALKLYCVQMRRVRNSNDYCMEGYREECSRQNNTYV